MIDLKIVVSEVNAIECSEIHPATYMNTRTYTRTHAYTHILRIPFLGKFDSQILVE